VSILDDFDARPGSAVSLARTVVGLYLRRLGGWISIGDLVRVMQHVGVDDAAARTAVARLKARGLLMPEARAAVKGYRLNPDAVGMLEAGDRRIFSPRRMAAGDPWCLISFSLPEQQRAERHQLRRRLHWIGCGTVSPALWICPATLTTEVEQILLDLGVRAHATLFESTDPRPAGTLADAVAGWWDLDELAAVHGAFLAEVEPLLRPHGDQLAGYVRGIDLWRPIPYLDPGLAREVLPEGWPGHRSEQLYAELAGMAASAAEQLSGLLRDSPALPAPGLRSR
jgi:phenylacetic acid degradation operon negative regulatory protein